MVTQGTNDGGSIKKRSYDDRKGSSFQGRRQNNQERPERTERPDRPRQGERRNDGSGVRGGTRGGALYQNGSRGSKDGENRYGRTERYDKPKSYTPKFSGKDDDDDDNVRRKPSRPKESKPSVSIPDKDKTMLRLEKEQKTMKKKQQSKKKESNRPQPRVKRSNNINYTRSYANGDFDDYEDYYDDF